MLTFNFTPFPNLETERLFLRRVCNADVNEVFALRSDPKTMQYIPRPLAKTNEDALEHIALLDKIIDANQDISWAITLKDNPKLIGIIGFYRTNPTNQRSEIGYILSPEFQKQGIATEAIKKIINFGFNQMKLHSIEAVIDPENIASERVLQKNSFIKEAHFRENGFFEGQFLDSVVYAILNKG